MWSLLPIRHLVRRALRLRSPSLGDIAERTWQIAPCEETVRPKAYFLPGQLERIRILSAFSVNREDEERMLHGRARVIHGPTRGFLLKDAVLMDGTLYSRGARDCLQDRTRRFPRCSVEESHPRGALYSTYGGNRYFGQWLIDDLVTYRLAKEAGLPVCTQRSLSEHGKSYEELLGVQHLRVASGHFRELVMFDDVGQNQNKRARFHQNRQALLSQFKVERHPGVFLLRKASGSRRILLNEEEIARHLEHKRGFRVIDTMVTDVPAILQAAAGAEVVAGIEGSHLVHAVVVMEPGRSLMTLQPPNRFCSLLKDLTDRDGQHFGLVVGQVEGDAFRVDPDEVERTLDLLPR